jgi:hypothetical protein
VSRELWERIYDAVAGVLDPEYVVRQNWGLSAQLDEAAGAAMAVLAEEPRP